MKVKHLAFLALLIITGIGYYLSIEFPCKENKPEFIPIMVHCIAGVGTIVGIVLIGCYVNDNWEKRVFK